MININETIKKVVVFLPDYFNGFDKPAFRYSLEKEILKNTLTRMNLLIVVERLRYMNWIQINEDELIHENTINTINKDNIDYIKEAYENSASSLIPLIVWDSYDNCTENLGDSDSFLQYFDVAFELYNEPRFNGKLLTNNIK